MIQYAAIQTALQTTNHIKQSSQKGGNSPPFKSQKTLYKFSQLTIKAE